jgi:hypothetical protein
VCTWYEVPALLPDTADGGLFDPLPIGKAIIGVEVLAGTEEAHELVLARSVSCWCADRP